MSTTKSNRDKSEEVDHGADRTLAACLTHASRTAARELAPGGEWRTGE